MLPVWRQTRGAGVTVAVVDTGVDRASADLAPNLLPGTNTYDGNDNTADAAGHGTVIASVIAAPAGNGGYVGIAPEAKILPVKVMGGASGKDWSDKATSAGSSTPSTTAPRSSTSRSAGSTLRSRASTKRSRMRSAPVRSS